ncbi:hypothetical protein C534_21198 [Pseudomonas aeruginosa P49]|nr:hypothetical protein C534_21198 [Pseudomonas aeruginosa P49]
MHRLRLEQQVVERLLEQGTDFGEGPVVTATEAVALMGKIPSTLAWRLLSGSPGTPGSGLRGIISGSRTLSTQTRTQVYI